MRLLRYIDRKFTLYDQTAYMVSFIFFGMPIGYIFSQIVSILIHSWDKYHFSVYNLLGNMITNLVILTPIIINYIRHSRKYNKIYNKVTEKTNNNKVKVKVKALYDYSSFIKGQSYEVVDEYFIMNNDKKAMLFIIDNQRTFPMKNIINKFELDDIKEDRMRKLKKLKKLW